jgi:CHASE2 domain-containing sensor protein
VSKKKQSSGRKRRWPRALRAHGAGQRVSIPRIVFGILVTLCIIFLFNRLGPLHKLQTFVLDVKMRLSDPPEHSRVAVVKIEDKDYQNIFGGRSPLDPAALRRVIDAIALGRPKVIGVDIDTSSPQFKTFQPGRNWPPVIWEREAKIPESVEHPVEMLDVLGGKDTALNADSGLPLFTPDHEDRVVRRYRREMHTTEGPFPTFVWALVQRFSPGRMSEPGRTDDDRFIAYAGDRSGSHRFNLTALQAIKLAEQGSLPDANPFRDKIVLLGGAYLDEDVHQTPLGAMRGVDVIAQAVETELRGGGDEVPNKATLLLLEVFEGALVVLLFQFFHRYRFGLALVLNLLVLFAIALVCGTLAFGSPLRFIYFLPLLLCVLVYEFFVEYRIDLVKQLGKMFGKDTDKNH